MKAEQHIYGDKLVTIYSMDKSEERLFAANEGRPPTDEESIGIDAVRSGKMLYKAKNRRSGERSETQRFRNKTPLLSKLPVYKKALDLEVQLCKSTENCPKVIKGKRLIDLHDNCISIIHIVAFASVDEAHRISALKEAQEKLRDFFIDIRILIDLGFVRDTAAILIKTEEELNVQISSWLKSLLKENNE